MKLLPTIITYSFGFWYGHVSGDYQALFFSIAFMIIFELLFRVVSKTYKFRLRENPNRFD